MKDTPTPPPKYSLHLNVEDWLPLLEDENIPETQKIELIETIWAIVLSFVDMDWDFETGPEIGGQSLDLTAALMAVMISSEDTQDQQKEEV